jgi:hypothetical protein
MSDTTPEEDALSHVREALSATNKVPATGLSGEQQHEQLLDAADSLEALEAALVNELDQKEASITS